MVFDFILTAVIVILLFAGLFLADRADKKIRGLKKQNDELIKRYEPIKQNTELRAGPLITQIQDVNDDGRNLLKTIVELLREHDKLLRDIFDKIGTGAKVPEVKPPELAQSPPKRVTKSNKAKKTGGGKDGGK